MTTHTALALLHELTATQHAVTIGVAKYVVSTHIITQNQDQLTLACEWRPIGSESPVNRGPSGVVLRVTTDTLQYALNHTDSLAEAAHAFLAEQCFDEAVTACSDVIGYVMPHVYSDYVREVIADWGTDPTVFTDREIREEIAALAESEPGALERLSGQTDMGWAIADELAGTVAEALIQRHIRSSRA